MALSPDGKIIAIGGTDGTVTLWQAATGQQCGSLLGGEPCDSYEQYGLGVRCIVHGGGFPDAMFPAVYDANMRIIQSPGVVAISYELIHDTRIIPLDGVRQPSASSPRSPSLRTYMGLARDHRDHHGDEDIRRHAEGEHARRIACATAGRAVHAHWPRFDRLHGDFYRSRDVDRAVDRRARLEGTAS